MAAVDRGPRPEYINAIVRACSHFKSAHLRFLHTAVRESSKPSPSRPSRHTIRTDVSNFCSMVIDRKTSLHSDKGTTPAQGTDLANDIQFDFVDTADEPVEASVSRVDRVKTQQQKTSGGLITVQPLKRSEMQPSYAQDLGLDDVQHGFYGSLINGAYR